MEALLAEFEDSALRVFRNACEYTNALESSHSLEILVSSLQDRLRATLTPELRAYNARQLARLGLPDEIWCTVWEQLSMFDCVAISQVCHHWRELAIGSPRLWLAPHFFSSSHSWECSCIPCTALDVAEIKTRHYTGPANFELVTHVLERTANLPLRVHLTVVATWSSHYAISHLLYPLAGYAHRLVELYFVTENTYIPRELMVHCVEFPALRTLVFRNLTGPTLEGIFDDHVSLPALEYLELDEPIHHHVYSSWRPRLSFPLVRTLRVVVPDAKRLDADISACPAVERLFLVMPSQFEHDSHWEMLEDARQRISPVKLVYISLSARSAQDILPIVHNPTRPALILDLGDKWLDPDDSHRQAGFAIFRDLHNPTTFSYVWNDIARDDSQAQRVSLLLRDNEERYREVHTPACTGMRVVWEFIDTTSLTTLIIGWDVWDLHGLLFTDMPPLAALREVEFIVSTAIVTFRGSLPLLPFPGLHTLRFSKPRGPAADVDVDDLSAIVSHLCGDFAPLRMLALRNVTPFGATVRLEGIAEHFEMATH